MSANYINHIVFVLDGSGSMQHLATQVVKVADEQIKHLAQRSKELDQETRVTIYSFESRNQIKCLVYDKDVLRVPSIKGLYRTFGDTPLIDATLKAIKELGQTATLYGDHSFLIYVLTDGGENSSIGKPALLADTLDGLPDNWTLAAFVPNALGVAECKRFGFPKANIQVWDTTVKGFEEAGRVIREATDSYMTARSTGLRGTKNLFALGTEGLSRSTLKRVVAGGNLKGLHFGQYRMWEVDANERIDEFVERKTRRAYSVGEAYYQLMVPVMVQRTKMIAIHDRGSREVFTGEAARKLIGLPDYDVKVAPASFPLFDIFVQSTSVNRKLLEGQKVLVL